MKSERFLIRLLAIGVFAAAAYFLLYTLIERRRTKYGPWEVAFTAAANGSPALRVQQPELGLTNITLVFQGAAATNAGVTMRFAEARPVPFDTPYGRCVFQDTLALPGTVVLEAYGRQIQLLPRVLTLDGRERPWRSGETVVLEASR